MFEFRLTGGQKQVVNKPEAVTLITVSIPTAQDPGRSCLVIAGSNEFSIETAKEAADLCNAVRKPPLQKLTAPNGNPIYFDVGGAVGPYKTSSGDAKKGAKADLTINGRLFHVQESPADVAKLIDAGGGFARTVTW